MSIPRVLCVLHPDGWLEVFSTKGSVKVAVVELQPGEDEYAGVTKRARWYDDLHYPNLLTATGMARRNSVLTSAQSSVQLNAQTDTRSRDL